MDGPGGPFISVPQSTVSLFYLDYDPQHSVDDDSQGYDGLILWMCTPPLDLPHIGILN